MKIKLDVDTAYHDLYMHSMIEDKILKAMIKADSEEADVFKQGRKCVTSNIRFWQTFDAEYPEYIDKCKSYNWVRKEMIITEKAQDE